MNGFEKHGIKHSSASNINMFTGAPCAWVARYLYNEKFTFGLAPKAGILVEDAVVNVLANGMSIEDATAAAVKDYHKASAIGASASEVKRGEGIPAMIEMAVKELEQYGKPEFSNDIISGNKQQKIELLCNGDGWKLPIIGYLDFVFPEHKLVVDLKTTMRAPSSMSIEHIRQGVIYKQATGFDVKFLYVTPKKHVWHEIGDTKEALQEIKTIMNRQEKLLRLESDNIKDIIPVNQGSFYWSDDVDMRKRIYGV